MILKNIVVLVLLSAHLVACGQETKKTENKSINEQTKIKKMENKMKIEIWSDVVCPFCYIGKRKFEMAMAQFPDKDNVEIIWKSYMLMPDMVTDPNKKVSTFC